MEMKMLTESIEHLTRAVDRNTEQTARMQEKLTGFMDKLFPELQKTETVKRLKADRKERLKEAQETLDELGL